MLVFCNKLQALIFPAIVIFIVPFSAGEESLRLPSFATKGHEVNVVPGANVTFPCEVNNQGSNSVIWKGGNNVIYFVENTPLFVETRYTLGYLPKRGYNFTIRNVSLQDEGEYICVINTDPTQEQTTKLNVNIPPSLVRNSPQRIEADLHQNVTLNCSATGKPQPEIHWTKEGSSLPDGTRFYTGDVLVFTNIHRKHNGVYKCTATNGVKNDVSATVTLNIEFEAVLVSNPHSVEHTGRKHTAKLMCAFDGNPEAQVTWYKGTSPALGPNHSNRDVDTQQVSSEYISVLKIENPKMEDLGNYTCVVKNSLGSANATYFLTGVPKSPDVTRKVHGKYSEVYYAKWTVIAYDKPEKYEILIRERPAAADSPKIQMNNTNRPWRTITVSANESTRNINEGNMYLHRYMIEGLQPVSTYEMKIRAKNFFGWSEFSDNLIFDTAEEGHTPPPPTTAPPSTASVVVIHHTKGHHENGHTPPSPTGPNSKVFQYGTDGKPGLRPAEEHHPNELNGVGFVVKGSLSCVLVGLISMLVLH